ncbi:hypothetical protein SAMN05216312_111248 [Cohnella sp. OV330]|uniref:hypothetical protein n=1 Tax=Cohnella sp. OV330 TaxID=1855288 RepID=UPI0008F0F768|nr:hypothetical protein [Cohnella sp. OV330]SFB52837.1 hypothetical protein SAMN05216312_111248 [Cohnella sp. OV330]
MWKWIGWAGQLIGAALLVSFLSIWTTGYIVTSYVQTALADYGITLDEQPFAMSGVWGKLWGADGEKNAAQGETKDSTGSDADEQAVGTPEATESPDADAEAGKDEKSASASASPSPDTDAAAGSGAATPTPGSDAESVPSPEPGPEPSGSVTNGQAAGSPGETGEGGLQGDGAVPVWNGDEGASAVSGLTDEEKQQIYSVVVSKLTGDQLAQLTGLIRNGLTDEEVPQMEALLKPILSDEEYATMMEALKVPQAQ